MNTNSRTNISKPVIPGQIVAKWQEIVDLISDLAGVPAGLIMKVHPREIEADNQNRCKSDDDSGFGANEVRKKYENSKLIFHFSISLIVGSAGLLQKPKGSTVFEPARP